jgi:FtsP/CotA-like multicopper oxidase with cupredoxin domain
MRRGFRKGEMDFIARNPGDMLFHRHQPLHMDFGFVAPFKYA